MIESPTFKAAEVRNQDTFDPEVLNRHYSVLVIDPYAINIKDIGPNAGDVRPSFYSAFVLHTAREIIEKGLVDEVVVFDDASFGSEHKSLGDLSFEYFTKDRQHKDGHIGPILDREKVHLFKGDNLARTPTQVQQAGEFLRDPRRKDQEVLYLGWDYHRLRVQNHARGFGVNAKYASAEFVHKILEPNFDLERLMEVLPMDEIEEMEAGGMLGGIFSRRSISSWDTKGRIPGLVQTLRGKRGPFMLDNKRNTDGSLSFDYRPGVDRLEELGMI